MMRLWHIVYRVTSDNGVAATSSGSFTVLLSDDFCLRLVGVDRESSPMDDASRNGDDMDGLPEGASPSRSSMKSGFK